MYNDNFYNTKARIFGFYKFQKYCMCRVPRYSTKKMKNNTSGGIFWREATKANECPFVASQRKTRAPPQLKSKI